MEARLFRHVLRRAQFPKDLMELAAMGEARYGRFALFTDIVYLKVFAVRASRARAAPTQSTARLAHRLVEDVVGRSPVRSSLRNGALEHFTGLNDRAHLYVAVQAWRRGEVNFHRIRNLNVFDLSLTREGFLSATKSVS